jgi:hypothetical protein
MFTQNTFAPVGPQASASPHIYSYSTSDDVSTVSASGYFSPKENQLETDDLIMAQCSDGFFVLRVSTSTDTVTQSIAATPTNEKSINSMDDFPDAVGGVITLPDDNINYVIGAALSTADRFNVTGNNVSFTANNIFGPTFTYTGVGTLFTGVDVNFDIRDIRLDAPNGGQLFDFSDTVGASVIFNCTSVSALNCGKWGTFNDLLSIIHTNSSCIVDCKDGVSILGTNINILSFTRFALLNTSVSGFVGIDLGTAVIINPEYDNLFLLSTDAAGIGISGLANGGNMPAGVVAPVMRSNFVGAITPLQNITVNDIRWEFSGNSGVAETKTDAEAILATPETVTINTIGVFEPVAGVNWASSIANRFTVSAAGLITYVSEEDIDVAIICSSTVEKVAGGADQICTRIAINGTTQIKTEACSENNTPTNVVSHGLFTLSQNDTIQMYTANKSTTTNVIVNLSNLVIIKT